MLIPPLRLAPRIFFVRARLFDAIRIRIVSIIVLVGGAQKRIGGLIRPHLLFAQGGFRPLLGLGFHPRERLRIGIRQSFGFRSMLGVRSCPVVFAPMIAARFYPAVRALFSASGCHGYSSSPIEPMS